MLSADKEKICASEVIVLIWQANIAKVAMTDLIQYPVLFCIPAFAGMTVLIFMVPGVIY
jgi:hypothetical protein